MNKILENKYLVSTIIAVVVFEITYGFLTLDPRNINWLMSAYHDWGTHYLGWAFYRNDPWGFPLTEMNSYYYPIGTNVGFTDTIPLLALFFKIFSGFLPEDFQFYGIWFLISYFLIAFYSLKIFSYYKIRPFYALLGTIIITANPVLAFRGMHPSLCAHWLLLASFYNYIIVSNESNVLKINKSQLFLFVLSATINPYLAAMVAGFNIIVPFKHYFYEKTLKLSRFVFFPTVSFSIGILVWIVFGLIVFENSTNLDVGNIYGLYAFNLNSFFNSYGYYSKFIPDLKMVTERQHEGFAYLGLGMIILTFISVFYVLLFNRRIFQNNKPYLPVAVLTLLLFVFAISNQVTFGTKVLFHYPTLGIVEKLGNIFRAIGRFVWLPYYLLILVSFVVFSRMKINHHLKLGVVLCLTILQLYDIENVLTSRDLKSGSFHTKLQDEKWMQILRNFDEIVTYPVYTNNLVYNMDYQDLSFLALKAKKPITNGYAARENLDAIKKFRDSLSEVLKGGEIENNRIYITNKANIKDFNVLLYKDKVELKIIDNFFLIYSKKVKLPLDYRNSAAESKTLDSIKKSFSGSRFRLLQNNWKTKDNLENNIERYSFSEDVLQISGWAFNREAASCLNDSIFIAFSNKSVSYVFPVNKVVRGDISDKYKRKDLDGAGFNATVFTDKLPKEAFSVALLVKDGKGNYHYSVTDKMSEVGKKKYQAPVLINKLPAQASIMLNMEVVNIVNKVVNVSGWAALENVSSKDKKIKIVLISGTKIYKYDTNLVMRSDVTEAMKTKINYNYSGFELKFLTKDLAKGTYKTGVIIEDIASGKSFYKEFDKTISL
ncbi:DUF6311 domain-containing protein [Flavobacterium limnosediminis]|uniref:DUF6311 domain-containing protein n=1 Tax=Flavobacterium limnosediminis TaxID=1401027 RepID=UPI0003F94A19|nr:DUF6311 domain-containing protein [Flavobacterium limnosediminis]